MAKLCLVRIDSRMIHGQVMTMWSKTDGINHILAIDDGIAADPFMKDIYMMAVPHTLKVMIVSVEEAAKMWQENTLPDDRYRFMDVDDPDLKQILDAFGITIPAKLYRRAELKHIKTEITVFM